MKQYILALDQGTTSSRAILFDHNGRLCGSAQQEFPQHFPQPGWVEHDANDIWESQIACARQVLRESGVSAGQVAGIGIANQRETTVVWDRKSGEPIGPAIVWQDRRTADDCERLRAQGKAGLIQEATGLELDAYFSATKLAWLLDNVAGARQRALRGELAFGTVDSWLVFKLTGRHVTDVSNASRTMLFNIGELRWDACWRCSIFRRRCCRTSSPVRRWWVIRTPAGSASRSRCPASPATSRRPPSARLAIGRAWSRILTAPAASC
jgi:glycerol kinase